MSRESSIQLISIVDVTLKCDNCEDDLWSGMWYFQMSSNTYVLTTRIKCTVLHKRHKSKNHQLCHNICLVFHCFVPASSSKRCTLIRLILEIWVKSSGWSHSTIAEHLNRSVLRSFLNLIKWVTLLRCLQATTVPCTHSVLCDIFSKYLKKCDTNVRIKSAKSYNMGWISNQSK